MDWSKYLLPAAGISFAVWLIVWHVVPFFEALARRLAPGF